MRIGVLAAAFLISDFCCAIVPEPQVRVRIARNVPCHEGGLAKKYRGKITKVKNRSGQCDFINELGMENYLKGVVNAEFNSNWSIESVKAQVIAARSYAYSLVRKKSSRPFDLESDVKDQVYEGLESESGLGNRIVESTKGKILLASGKPFRAFYHSTCGGKTRLPEEVWGKKVEGYRRKVRCPHCVRSPRFHWSLDLHGREIASILPLNNSELILKKGKLWSVRNDAATELDSLALRAKLSPSRMRSTQFKSLKKIPNGWTLQGRGNGHGVGMCQWGAKVMAEKGASSPEILAKFYPEARVRKFW